MLSQLPSLPPSQAGTQNLESILIFAASLLSMILTSEALVESIMSLSIMAKVFNLVGDCEEDTASSV